MRLWSIHPKYLDQKGLVACWRESLLAKKVLEGNTKGYKNHPQLNRFKDNTPIVNINMFLYSIHLESIKRGYNFDHTKIGMNFIDFYIDKIPVTRGQIVYEFKHILNKTYDRNMAWYSKLTATKDHIECNPIFKIVESSELELWEVL